MKMNVITGGLCAVRGVKAYGLKEGNKGLAVILGEGTATGVFTANTLSAAPVRFTQQQLRQEGRISAIVANSGCANSFTGEPGWRDAGRMAELLAARLNVPQARVAVASTGPIGAQLDMPLIERQLGVVTPGLTADPAGSMAAAKAIMTTDTFPKEAAVLIETEDGTQAAIGGIAKGSGMISPHMCLATMLCFIYTDAQITRDALSRSLQEAADLSFNMTVVDGDMSTNDMVLLVATGQRGKISEPEFTAGLTAVCQQLAQLIARDGEGATKFVEVTVTGAPSTADAREIARAIVRSPLVKSAIFGERPDLTCGRIISTIGSTAISRTIDPQGVSILLKSDRECLAVKDGVFRDLSGVARELMKGKELRIEVDLGMGRGAEATAWGCDLSYEYVRINAVH